MKHIFLDLGQQPIANSFQRHKKTEYLYDLKIQFDDQTKLVSLVNTVDKTKLFNEKYPYRADQSQTMIEHFKNVAGDIKKEFQPSLVLEIGSNTGEFIKNFNPKGYKNRAIAVEPCSNFAAETRAIGYDTFNFFWNKRTAEIIRESHGPVDVVYAANCLCHFPESEIQQAFEAIYDVLSDDGVLIFEDPSLLETIKNNWYYQFYDEHPVMFSLISLSKLLDKANMSIFRVRKLSTHGGSNRVYAFKSPRAIERSIFNGILEEMNSGLDSLETYIDFSQKVAGNKKDLVNELTKLKESGQKVVGYGASTKLVTAFNYCGIDENLVEHVVDTTLSKHNTLLPGKQIKVLPYNDENMKDVNVAYLGAANFIKEIMEKEKHRNMKFLVDVPEVRIVE